MWQVGRIKRAESVKSFECKTLFEMHVVRDVRCLRYALSKMHIVQDAYCLLRRVVHKDAVKVLLWYVRDIVKSEILNGG